MERVAAAALASVLLIHRERRAVRWIGVALVGALLASPIYHAAQRYLDQLSPEATTPNLPPARYDCRSATFAASCVSGGTLHVGGSSTRRGSARPQTLRLASSWMGSNMHPMHVCACASS